jgi:hypothetical protein
MKAEQEMNQRREAQWLYILILTIRLALTARQTSRINIFEKQIGLF